MKKYTETEKNAAYNIAIKDLTLFSESTLKDYILFLKELKAKANFKNKGQSAFNELQRAENKISNFIFINYPKTDEIFQNGLVYYTIETFIHINLTLESFEIQKKLQELFKNFLEDFD